MADHDATPLGWALIGCGGAGRAGILSTLLVEKITESIHTGLPQKIEVPNL